MFNGGLPHSLRWTPARTLQLRCTQAAVELIPSEYACPMECGLLTLCLWRACAPTSETHLPAPRAADPQDRVTAYSTHCSPPCHSPFATLTRFMRSATALHVFV